MLLFLTNIGDVFAKVFTWLYRRAVLYNRRMSLWRKKRRLCQMRLRLERQVEAFKRFQRDVSLEFSSDLVAAGTGSEKAGKGKYRYDDKPTNKYLVSVWFNS